MAEYDANHSRSGSFTLDDDGVATTTVVSMRGISSNSRLFLEPLDEGAWDELLGNTLRWAKAKGEVTFTHSASATARTFGFHWMPGPRV